IPPTTRRWMPRSSRSTARRSPEARRLRLPPPPAGEGWHGGLPKPRSDRPREECPMPVHPATTALLVIDLQPDFMPGGALPCHEGDAVVPGIAALLASRAYHTVVATEDWHPPGHASFASSHAGRAPFD